MTTKHWIIVSSAVAGLAIAVGLLWPRTQVVAPTTNTAKVNVNQPTSNANTSTNTTTFSTVDLPDRDPRFSFSTHLPSGWVAEYVPGSRAIIFLDPQAGGTSNLEKTRVFVTYFEATTFQTLTTVEVKSRSELSINERPAVQYVIAKKSGVADFTAQPDWRNRQHQVTDIRTTSDSPTIFYAFAQAPDLPEEIFSDILRSFTIIN